MPFMFDTETVQSICKQLFPEDSYITDLLDSINWACKLGYIRKQSHNKKLGLNFSGIFPPKRPDQYFPYFNDKDFDINKIYYDLPNENKTAIDINTIPSTFKDNEWLYCRGHDLMGILASYYVKKRGTINKSGSVTIPGKAGPLPIIVSSIEKSIFDSIVSETKPNKYKNSQVIKFLSEITNQSQI